MHVQGPYQLHPVQLSFRDNLFAHYKKKPFTSTRTRELLFVITESLADAFAICGSSPGLLLPSVMEVGLWSSCSQC